MLDGDGYPDDLTLDTIRDWDFRKGFREWLEYVQDTWYYPDYFRSRVLRDGRVRFYVSTGGWSGNEELISAMRRNFICWSYTWVMSRRGGHYVFEVTPPDIEKH